MTEDEATAKTRVCCGPPQTINGKEPLLLCLGSACMAWRYAMKRNPDWKPTHQMMVSGYDTHPDDQVRTHVVDTSRGYCGLAGRP